MESNKCTNIERHDCFVKFHNLTSSTEVNKWRKKFSKNVASIISKSTKGDIVTHIQEVKTLYL